ncbi:hypothetical protein SDC9_83120 [bioreactor metagenome]|uniref:Uncharacterized protein n=1 Tax=bioreactor metagenome TaxID=1076179 RepID=A0A644Z6T1_9ZZZZ
MYRTATNVSEGLVTIGNFISIPSNKKYTLCQSQIVTDFYFVFCRLSTDNVYFVINIDYFRKKVIINKIKDMCAYHVCSPAVFLHDFFGERSTYIKQ